MIILIENYDYLSYTIMKFWNELKSSTNLAKILATLFGRVT